MKAQNSQDRIRLAWLQLATGLQFEKTASAKPEKLAEPRCRFTSNRVSKGVGTRPDNQLYLKVALMTLRDGVAISAIAASHGISSERSRQHVKLALALVRRKATAHVKQICDLPIPEIRQHRDRKLLIEALETEKGE